jgi:hypothetical protein
MKTIDFNTAATSDQLNENMFKKFGSKVNFKKYTREQLEDYRNRLRTKISQIESSSGFNELLAKEDYQQDKFLLGLLNTRINEMLEETTLTEPAVSVKQQQAAGAALAAKRKGNTKGLKGASKTMSKMSTKELEKFAGTKHKGLPKKKAKKKTNESRSPWKLAHHHAQKYAECYMAGNLDEALYHKEQCEACGGVITHEMGECWHQHAAANKGNKYMVNKFAGVMGESKDDEPKKVASTGGTQTRKGNVTTHKAGTGKYGGTAGAKDEYGHKGDDDDDKKDESVKASKIKENKMSGHYKQILESLKHFLAEDEEGKAKDITAGTDMVNDFTSWMQRVGQYQTKSMIELADSIRANFGQAESDTFKSAVAPALQEALSALTQSRETITRAVSVLAGGEAAMSPMGTDMSGTDPTMPNATSDMDSMNAAPEDEFSASDAAVGGSEVAGREMRESKEDRKARRLAEQHSIISKLAK